MPSALPHVSLRDRGYEGPIYHNHGVINPDFLRVGGKALEGGFAPTGPVMVATQLPDDNPIKEVALEFKDAVLHLRGCHLSSHAGSARLPRR